MDIDRFLADHDGVVSRDQARACGLSDRQIARRVASGAWVRRAPEVYLVIAWAATAMARVRIAAEWAEPRGGALVGIAAAFWLGLGVDGPHPITVALPHGSARPPRGVRAQRRDLRGDHLQHRGLRVAGTALTVLDAAVALGRGGMAFLDRALQQHVTLDELRLAHHRHFGRRGSTAAGRLIARAGDRAASVPERQMIALLRSAGVTGWVVNLALVLRDGREVVVDLAFPGARFAVEVDGWAHHVDHPRFVGGRRRKRALVAEGWTVVEVSAWDLEHDPAGVIADLRAALARLDAA